MTPTHLTNQNAPRYHMPAEWEEHEATWLTWPHYQKDWPSKIPTVRWAFVEMAHVLSRGEQVRILLRHERDRDDAMARMASAHVPSDRIEYLIHPTNRSWVRDSGPIFVRDAEHPQEPTLLDFHFTAWARYPNWQRDNKIPSKIAHAYKCARVPVMHNKRQVILEGGSIDVNGAGTLLTTEECLLDPITQCRNPGYTKATYEAVFREYLGITNVIWLGAGILGDDTHGHVDDLTRFVNPTTLVTMVESNKRDDNHAALANNRKRLSRVRLENGKVPEIIELPMPQARMWGELRLPASYANFYIGNAAVLVPTFNDPNDRIALSILADLFPTRTVVGIHAIDLVLGRGSIHCLTQQQPSYVHKKRIRA